MLKPAIALFLWFVCFSSFATAEETRESTVPDDWTLSTLELETFDVSACDYDDLIEKLT